MRNPGHRHVFFYGTLNDPDVLQAVLRRRVPKARFVKGLLSGYRRVYVRNQPYPMIYPCTGFDVDGQVFLNCSPVEWARLCAYEEDDYDVGEVDIQTPNTTLAASVFLGGPRQPQTQKAWDLAAWQRREKRAFMRRWAANGIF